MDLNAAKYPAEALYYTDIKSYEQGAGQRYIEGVEHTACLVMPADKHSLVLENNISQRPRKAPPPLLVKRKPRALQ